jgi:hypothetical protein
MQVGCTNEPQRKRFLHLICIIKPAFASHIISNPRRMPVPPIGLSRGDAMRTVGLGGEYLHE